MKAIGKQVTKSGDAEGQDAQALSDAEHERLTIAARMMNEVLAGDLERNLFGEASDFGREVEIVSKALITWFHHSKDGVVYSLHEDDLTDMLAKWGQWMREKIALGDSDAFKRLATLTEVFAKEGRIPAKVSIKELRFKRPRQRPESDFAKEKLFARAAFGFVMAALLHCRRPDGLAIRDRMDELRGETKVGNKSAGYRIDQEEFSRCVSHYGLKGLVSFKGK